MPGLKDEITIRENGTEKQRKYYLTMFLREVYKSNTELPVSDKVKFYKFCDLCSKKLLLLKQSHVDKCKCIIHKSFINKLKAQSILYDSSSFWDTVFCKNTTNWQCWQENCDDCADSKNGIMNIDPGKNVLCKEWKYIDIKFQVMTQRKYIGGLLESLVGEWDFVLTHINIKCIQTAQF